MGSFRRHGTARGKLSVWVMLLPVLSLRLSSPPNVPVLSSAA